MLEDVDEEPEGGRQFTRTHARATPLGLSVTASSRIVAAAVAAVADLTLLPPTLPHPSLVARAFRLFSLHLSGAGLRGMVLCDSRRQSLFIIRD